MAVTPVRTSIIMAVALGTLMFGAVSAHQDAEPPLREPGWKHRAAQIINSFEYSTTTIRYDEVERLFDGRGYTAGRAGFTSGTGDMLLVAETYAEERPGSLVAQYIRPLRRVNGTDSVAGLEGLPFAWRISAADPLFREVQDEVADELYYKPALEYARQLDIGSPVGRLIFWDTIIQHGGGDDPDSIGAIIRRTGGRTGTETEYLAKFLDERERTLLNAHDTDTRAEWRESVDRVRALRRILRTGNMELDPSIGWSVYGDQFRLDK